jgi:hypothetical protein
VQNIKNSEKEVPTHEKFFIPGYAQPVYTRPYGPTSSTHIPWKGSKTGIHGQVN